MQAGAVFLALGMAVSAQAGKLSWFDDAPFAGVGSVGIPEVRLRNPSEYTSFDIDVYRSRSLLGAEELASNGAVFDSGISMVRLYGEIGSSGNRPQFSSFEKATNRINAFGVKWQHRLDATHSFAVSAEYGQGTAIRPLTLDTTDTRAAVSWTSRLPIAGKPSITGSFFLGDELAREEIYRQLDHKYYGITIGGSMTLNQTHTPYVSFKMQKSLYDTTDESTLLASRSSDRSLLSAGWKWQVQRDFSLQAEASYALGSTPYLDSSSFERSRILFRTRFDFN
jgi:hypothetical protein